LRLPDKPTAMLTGLLKGRMLARSSGSNVSARIALA
jgi:hypothetical protein